MWREVGTAFMYHCVKFIQPSMCILRGYTHGRLQGGARGGTCPPLEIQKYGGPPKNNLTRKI